MARKATVLSSIDVTIRKIADNENISAEERLKLINDLLDMRIALSTSAADTGAPETRSA